MRDGNSQSKTSDRTHHHRRSHVRRGRLLDGGGDARPRGRLRSRNTVVGLTLQLWDQTRLAGKHGIPDAPKAGRCCSLDDVYDARRVAEHLGIPYYVVNQQERFERDVVRPFVAEYLAGRTPIPCSLCNNHLKFDQLLQTARSIGASRIATGHYAVNEYDPQRERWIFKRPADLAKDQTYFLFGLTQEQLAHTLFPLGRLTKPEVREARDSTASRWPKSPTRRRSASSPAATTSSSSPPISKSKASGFRRRRAKW